MHILTDNQLACLLFASPFLILSLAWLIATTAITFWGDE